MFVTGICNLVSLTERVRAEGRKTHKRGESFFFFFLSLFCESGSKRWKDDID